MDSSGYFIVGGRIVVVLFNVVMDPAASGYTIPFILPEGFRPATYLYTSVLHCASQYMTSAVSITGMVRPWSGELCLQPSDMGRRYFAGSFTFAI